MRGEPYIKQRYWGRLHNYFLYETMKIKQLLSISGKKALLISLSIVAVLSLFYWPTFRWLVQSWLSNDYYSHGFLVPLVSAFFIWTKRSQLRERRPSLLSLVFLAMAVVLYVLSDVLEMRVLGGLSLLTIIVAIALAVMGKRATWAIAFPLSFLIFMIPFPFIQEVGYHLQQISISATSWVLDFTPLDITMNAARIKAGGETFTIGLPCAGVNTLIALLALAAIYVYLLKGPVYKRTLLFVLAFPLAVLANIVRVISIVLVAYYIDTDFAGGTYHDYIANPLFYFLAFLILALIGWLMGCRLVEER